MWPSGVERQAAERARRPAGRDDGARRAWRTRGPRAGEPDPQQVRPVELGRRRRLGVLGSSSVDGACASITTRSVVAVPGQRHARRPGTPPSIGCPAAPVVELGRGDGRDGADPPVRRDDLVEQLVDALGQHRHLLLLQRDAGRSGRRARPAGRRCAARARRPCRRRTARAGRTRRPGGPCVRPYAGRPAPRRRHRHPRRRRTRRPSRRRPRPLLVRRQQRVDASPPTSLIRTTNGRSSV